MSIKVDMHIHTSYSKDSFLSLERLFSACRRKGIGCIAITDHNTIKGALEFQNNFPLKTIVGEEIESEAGEIIGLFLKEKIPPGLSAGKTIAAIKKQGGLVYLPHPFDRWRKAAVNFKSIELFWNEIDIVEVFNSRCLVSSWNEQALKLAKEKNKPYGIGSDAHSDREIGKSFLEMEDFDSAREFIDNLITAKIIRQRRTPLILRLLLKSINMLSSKPR